MEVSNTLAMIGCSNLATLDLAFTGAALVKLICFLGTNVGRLSHLQVIVPYRPLSPRYFITSSPLKKLSIAICMCSLYICFLWSVGSLEFPLARSLIMSTMRFTSAGPVAANGALI